MIRYNSHGNYGDITSSHDLKYYLVIRDSNDIRTFVFRIRHDDMIYGTMIKQRQIPDRLPSFAFHSRARLSLVILPPRLLCLVVSWVGRYSNKFLYKSTFERRFIRTDSLQLYKQISKVNSSIEMNFAQLWSIETVYCQQYFTTLTLGSQALRWLRHIIISPSRLFTPCHSRFPAYRSNLVKFNAANYEWIISTKS